MKVNKYLLLKCISIGIFLAIVSQPLHSQDWTKLPNSGKFINRIFAPVNNPNRIVIASDNDSVKLDKTLPFQDIMSGNGIIVSEDRGKTFPTHLLDGYLVFDIFNPSYEPQNWYAAARMLDQGSILKSTDNLVSFNNTNYCEGFPQAFKFAEDTFNKGYLAYSASNTDEGFNYTTDGFEVCNPNKIIDIQSRYLSISKLVPGLMYIAGDNQFAEGVWRSLDSGKTWTRFESGLERLRVLCVLASSTNPAVVFCGADTVMNLSKGYYQGRGLYMSLDTGKTWTLAAAKGYRVFEIAQHPTQPRHLAAACDKGGVFISSATGYYWEQRSNGIPENALVRNIAIPNWDATPQGFKCIAGTYGDGAYISGDIVTSVEEKTKPIINIYPNPANNIVNLILNDYKNDNYIKIEISDICGNSLCKLFEGNTNELQEILTWNVPNELANGMYILKVQTEKSVNTFKLQISK